MTLSVIRWSPSPPICPSASCGQRRYRPTPHQVEPQARSNTERLTIHKLPALLAARSSLAPALPIDFARDMRPLPFVTSGHGLLPPGIIRAIPAHAVSAHRIDGSNVMVRADLRSPATAEADAIAAPPLCERITAAPPVFLHTGWRTRGTWIWSRFRALPCVSCFYEPLSEDLAALDAPAIDAHAPSHWPSGHPPLGSPYFAEYRALLKRGRPGVAHYQMQFASSAFFAEPDQASPALHDYIALLVQAAHGGGAQPVLKFCRSLGRIGWMQQHFPQAIHVAVARNPLAQFVSAHRQSEQWCNPYFLAMPLLLLATHRDAPDAEAAIRHLAVALPALPARASTEAKLKLCATHLRDCAVEERYRGFLAFWLATAVRIPGSIDLIIDSDLLAGSAEYRGQCEIDLATLTGCTLDLSDARANPARDAARLGAAGLPPVAIWRAHHAAEACLAERAGAGWISSPVLARLGAMLAYATLLGTSPMHAVGFDPGLALEDTSREARLLAAVHASHSWRITAPLRWLSQRVQTAVARA